MLFSAPRILFVFLSLLAAIALGAEEEPTRVVMIGDSTMATKKENRRPETGWGEALPDLLADDLVVENYAVNGRSTKSFIDEGRWDEARERLRPGDFLIVQFGHNDEKDQDPTRYTEPFGSYQDNLTRFVSEARERGASVILATSISRRKFDTAGKVVKSHRDYPSAVRELAGELSVPLVDMEALTRAGLENVGDEASKALFMRLAPGEFENYPEGKTDDTHLQPAGAEWHAKLFVEALKALGHPLSQRLATAGK